MNLYSIKKKDFEYLLKTSGESSELNDQVY